MKDTVLLQKEVGKTVLYRGMAIKSKIYTYPNGYKEGLLIDYHL